VARGSLLETSLSSSWRGHLSWSMDGWQQSSGQRRWDATAHRNRRDDSRWQVDNEVLQALDGWPDRQREFADEDTRRGAGEDLGEDESDRRAPSVSDGDVVTAGKPTRARRWAGSASSWAGRGENGSRRFFFQSNSFFQLNKSARGDKIGEIFGCLRKI
jgi:hypothetical protein